MIVTITGKNQFAANAKYQELVDEYKSEHGDTNLRRFSLTFEELPDIIAAIQTPPFLAKKSLTIISDTGTNKALLEDLQNALSDHDDFATIIIYDPTIDKRTTFYKFVKNDTVLHDFPELQEYELVNWLAEQAKQRGIGLDKAQAQILAERVDNDVWRASNELDKLGLFDEPITNELISAVVEATPRQTIFDMLDSLFSGRQEQALTIYKQLMSAKVEPIYVLSMLIWQLHNMLLAAHAGSRSLDDLAKDVGVSAFALKKAQNVARKKTKTQLKQMMQQLAEVDAKIKSSSTDAELLVDTTIRQLAIL